MRDIKFRAWDKENKFMSDVTNLAQHWVVTEDINPSEAYTLDQVELMQYTGLKDKNGVEIYEGDIVDDNEACYCIVTYNDDNAMFELEYYDFPTYMEQNGDQVPYGDVEVVDTEMLDEKHMKTRRVIGNIYENPELIKQ